MVKFLWMYEGTNALLEGMSIKVWMQREVFWSLEILITGKCKRKEWERWMHEFYNYTFYI